MPAAGPCANAPASPCASARDRSSERERTLMRENAELRRTIETLQRQNADLEHEKSDLELLIETNIEHSDLIAEDLLAQLDSARTLLLRKVARLRREIHALQQEVLRLQEDRADLEVLLDMNIRHSDSVEEDLLKKVELTLRESERRFRLISETIPVPITVSRSADHRIVYANKPASALFGSDLTTLYQHRLTDFFPDAFRQQLLRLLTTRTSINTYDVQGKTCAGAIFFGTLYARPLTFNGEACLLCAIHDMTERKQAEDEIRVLNEQLEARVQQRTDELEAAHARIVKLEKEAVEVQMAGGFAHEMRNALVGAKLMLTSVIDENETLCQKNVTLLETLYNEIGPTLSASAHMRVVDVFGTLEEHEEILDTMLRMINQALVSALGVTTLILEYSRLGRATAGRETVSLNEVIDRIAREHQPQFQAQGIDLRTALAPTAALRGHESHFHSIINNIVVNARDELLEVPDDRQRVIEIRLFQDDDAVIVVITDTANGMPDEVRAKIFEPFFSTKPTTGTGLGLSFVAKLVPLYHGDIQVTSRLHEGTAFRLTFPVLSESESDGG